MHRSVDGTTFHPTLIIAPASTIMQIYQEIHALFGETPDHPQGWELPGDMVAVPYFDWDR